MTVHRGWLYCSLFGSGRSAIGVESPCGRCVIYTISLQPLSSFTSHIKTNTRSTYEPCFIIHVIMKGMRRRRGGRLSRIYRSQLQFIYFRKRLTHTSPIHILYLKTACFPFTHSSIRYTPNARCQTSPDTQSSRCRNRNPNTRTYPPTP